MKKVTIWVLCVALLLSAVSTGFAATYDESFHLDGTLPICDDWGDRKPLKIVSNYSAQCMTDYDDMAQIQRIVEETGLKFEWITFSSSVAGEKINMMLASRDLPDVFWKGVGDTTVSQYIGQDVFLPTTELINEYCPNLADIFERYPEYAGLTVYEDGNRYGFPWIEEIGGLVRTMGPMMINQVWLDALGLEMPTTVEELKEVLIAFRDGGDLNGNGLDDEFPLASNFTDATAYASHNAFFYLMGCFGETCTYGASYPYCKLDDARETVIFPCAEEAFLDCIQYFRGLYEENLIDPDGLAGINFTNKTKGDTAVYGVFPIWDPEANMPNPDVRNQYVALNRISGPAGKSGAALNRSEQQVASMMLITTACECPEVVTALANYLYRPEISITTNWGAIGYNFEYNEKGQLYTPTDENGQFLVPEIAKTLWGAETFNDARVNSTPMAGCAAVLTEYYFNVIEGYVYGGEWLLGLKEDAGMMEVLAEDTPLPPFTLSSDEQVVVSQIQSQLINLLQSFMIGGILDGNAEENWDAYRKELEDAGLEKMLAAIQSGYERYQANSES